MLDCMNPKTCEESIEISKCEVQHYLNNLDTSKAYLRYPRYGEDPDTGWSRGTQILGAWHSYLAGVGKNALSQIIVKQQLTLSDTMTPTSDTIWL